MKMMIEALDIIKSNPEWLEEFLKSVPKPFSDIIRNAIEIENALNKQNWQFDEVKTLFSLFLSHVLDDSFDRESLVKEVNSGFDVWLAEINELCDSGFNNNLKELNSKE